MSSSVSSPDDQGGVCILEIGLKSDQPLKSATLKIETSSGSVVHQETKKTESVQVTFIVPRNAPLTAGSTLRIQRRRSSLPVVPPRTITIRGSVFLDAYEEEGDEEQEWKQSYGDTEISIQLSNRSGGASTSFQNMNNQSDLTTIKIRKICPQFRILVLGKSGAGKSSLINQAFGVIDAHVADNMPGEADINKEILSEDNPLFVLHDSRGFEGGETETLQIAEHFIQHRGKMTKIKSKLHAVWVCLEIPTAGGRLMETGVEKFLKLGAGGGLGKVPIIVVFTKLDELVTAERVAMVKENLDVTVSENEETIIKEATERANTKVERDCILPFKELVGENIPYVTVSTNTLYRHTLTKLIEVTFKHVTDYISEAGILSGISQKVNPDVKILTSIEVGKRNYWKGLVSETVPGIAMKDFLAVIHADIVNVWNLDDKYNYLHSPAFKELMLRTVEDVEVYNPNKAIILGQRIAGAVGLIASLFAGPATLIAIPIAATVAVVTWIYVTNHQTHDNLRRMMTYVISLTIVMQNLFWIQSTLAIKLKPSDGGAPDRVSVPIKRRLILQALALYLSATDREVLLTQISNYVKKVNLVTHRSDTTVKEIARLLHAYTINNEDAFRQQRSVKKLDKSWEDEEDVPWIFPMFGDAM